MQFPKQNIESGRSAKSTFAEIDRRHRGLKRHFNSLECGANAI